MIVMDIKNISAYNIQYCIIINSKKNTVLRDRPKIPRT